MWYRVAKSNNIEQEKVIIQSQEKWQYKARKSDNTELAKNNNMGSAKYNVKT